MPGDLDDLCRLHRDERVMATLGGLRGPAWTAELLAGMLGHWRGYGYGLWIVRDRGTRAFLGRGGLRRVEVAGRCEVEVAYALVPGAWGRGLATELAAESAAAAFGELALTELVAFTLPDNRASQRVMEKVGFRFEREIARAGLPHRLYRLGVAAWRARC